MDYPLVPIPTCANRSWNRILNANKVIVDLVISSSVLHVLVATLILRVIECRVIPLVLILHLTTGVYHHLSRYLGLVKALEL